MRKGTFIVFLLFLGCFELWMGEARVSSSRGERKKLKELSSATVFKTPKGNTFYLQEGIEKSGIAFGTFEDTLNKTGWGVLRIQTNKDFSDNEQMFAAGFLEGALTQAHIFTNFQNMYNWAFRVKKPSAELLEFLQKQDEWMRKEIRRNHTSYWKQVSYVISQFDGLLAGYNAFAPEGESLEAFAFQFLNGMGDFFDLIPATNKKKKQGESQDDDDDWHNLSLREFKKKIFLGGHCSALVKITPDFQELYSAHSSWFTYSSTDRIYKYYHFDLTAPFVSARKVSFSSYPGFLVSMDDFYIMDNGLVMIQTTNSIFNASLYDMVLPSSLFAWTRVRIANSLASNGEQWKEYFSLYNSGTYVNQYMIIDYNRFTPGRSLGQGTLWVVEQIPGLVVGRDMTNVLSFGYWASYNVPYFPEIFDQSGYPAIVKIYGPGFTHELAPRAQIFRRDSSTVVDLASLQRLMRSNNYKTDPLSDGDPMDAICSRGDLDSTIPTPDGCYDTKVTSSRLAAQGACYAINGPTISEGVLPPFSWSNRPFTTSPHGGLPSVYNFDFVVMNTTSL